MTKLLVESSPPSRRAPTLTSHIVEVPHLEHHDFVALMHVETDYHDPAFEYWSFLTDERGQTFDMLMWRPCAVLSSSDVRRYFRSRGFFGNTAAFLTWILQDWPSGCYATIPEDDELLHHYEDGLCVPCYSSVAGSRRFRRMLLGDSWGGRWAFLAFKRVTFS